MTKNHIIKNYASIIHRVAHHRPRQQPLIAASLHGQTVDFKDFALERWDRKG
jgi:hypothetical protein